MTNVEHEGGIPLYKLYRSVPPQGIWFLSRFGLKVGMDFTDEVWKWVWILEAMSNNRRRGEVLWLLHRAPAQAHEQTTLVAECGDLYAN